MTVEEKVLEKFRQVLTADPTIFAYVGAGVYMSHISAVDSPAMPAISMFLLSSKQDFAARGLTRISIQLDTWFPSERYTGVDILAVLEKIRSLLDRQNLNDTTIDVKIPHCIEVSSGPLMDDPGTNLLHYPTIMEVVAL